MVQVKILREFPLDFLQPRAFCSLFSQLLTLSPSSPFILQREPSQGDEASDMVTLDEDFPVSHTRTMTLDEEVECDGSDCKWSLYHTMNPSGSHFHRVGRVH